MNGLVLVAFLSATVFAAPVIDSNESSLETRADEINPHMLKYYTETNYKPDGPLIYYVAESYPGIGDCLDMKANIAKSAKAPNGYKCTIYSDKGCHGWRTREFNQDGIPDMGQWMNNNGAAFRCCKIGLTNGWGYCDAKLNGGTFAWPY